MTMASDLRREAIDLERTARADVAAIQADENASQKWKEEQAARRVAKYAQDLQALQESAARMLTGRRATVQKKLAELAEAAVQRQRELLGDEALLVLERDRMAVSTPAQIMQRVEESAGDWQRALRLELATIEVARRMQGPKVPEAVGEAHYALEGKAAKAEPEVDALKMELHELADIDTFVANLDISAQRVDWAGRVGVSAALYEMPA